MANPQQAASAYQQTYNDGASKARSDLTRWLRDDDSGHFDNAKIWNGDIQFTGQTADDLLNEAVPGLDWFERALVRYHRVWDLLKLPGFDQIVIPANTAVGFAGDTVSTVDDPRGDKGEMRRLEGQYFDQQRGMNVDSLRQLAQQLQTAATGGGGDAALSQVAQEVAGVANAVPEVWQGQSGDAAQDHMVGFHAHADQQSQFVQALASVLQGLPDVLLAIVKDKATFIGQFGSEQMPVAGHAMKLDGSDDPVGMIIASAAGKATQPHMDDVMQQQFHSGVTGSDNSDAEKETCKAWLTDHFGPAVREAVIAFVNQCVLADYYIKQAYKPVTDLLGNQDPAEFPKPQQPGPPQNSNQPGPSSSGPANTNTAGLQTSPTPTQPNPAATNPASLNPASPQSNPLSGLLSQAQQTMQTVESGVGQLSSTLQSGASQAASALQTSLSGLTGNTANPASAISSATGSRQLASFSLGGENLSVSQGSDGTVTTTVTGPDGKAQKFSMGIKNGVPFFTPGGDPAATTSKNAAHDAASAAGHGGGGGALGGGAVPSPMSTSDSHPVPQVGSSIPVTGATSTTTASTSTAGTAPAAASAAGGGMGGMPHMGGGGGGGGKADGEHKSSGVVQARPMWTKDPGSDRKPVIDSAAAAPAGGKFGIDEAPDEQFVPNADFEPASLYEPAPAQSPPQGYEPASGHQLNLPSQEPAVPAPVATPAPGPRTDGVKIEIDMGDGK